MTPAEILAPTYLKMLGALSTWLGKATQQLPEDKAQTLPSARLAPDMFPLATQVRFTCAQALEAMSRLRGEPFPALHESLLAEGRNAADQPGTLDDAQGRIAETIALVTSLCADADKVASPATIAHDIPNGMIFDLTAEQYVRDWALGQFYFHLMAAYAILRNQGVALGKADYVQHMFQHIRPGTMPSA